MTALGLFLRDGAARPRQAGTWDCGTFPAAWAIANGYPDPMAAWRDTYDTDEGASAIAEAGLVEAFEQALGGAGVPRVDGEPQAGDIGVISILGAVAGSVFTGERWAFVSERGMVFAPLQRANVLALWRVAPHG